MYNVILIGGKAGAGKDTLANYLVNALSFKRYAFADILKKSVAKKYSIDEKDLHTQEGKNKILFFEGKSTTYRQLLIDEAMNRRKIDEDVWAKLLVDEIKNSKDTKIVIPDFRFSNEYQTILRNFNNVVTIRVDNPNVVPIDDVSETSLDNFLFDHVLKNDSSKQHLFSLLNDLRLISSYFNKQ